MQDNIKKQKLEFVSEEKRMSYLKEIIAFFHDERNEEIGFVAAEKLFDFFMQTIGDDIYKKAIRDTKKLLRERLEDLDYELDSLSEKTPERK